MSEATWPTVCLVPALSAGPPAMGEMADPQPWAKWHAGAGWPVMSKCRTVRLGEGGSYGGQGFCGGPGMRRGMVWLPMGGPGDRTRARGGVCCRTCSEDGLEGKAASPLRPRHAWRLPPPVWMPRLTVRVVGSRPWHTIRRLGLIWEGWWVNRVSALLSSVDGHPQGGSGCGRHVCHGGGTHAA